MWCTWRQQELKFKSICKAVVTLHHQLSVSGGAGAQREQDWSNPSDLVCTWLLLIYFGQSRYQCGWWASVLPTCKWHNLLLLNHGVDTGSPTYSLSCHQLHRLVVFKFTFLPVLHVALLAQAVCVSSPPGVLVCQSFRGDSLAVTGRLKLVSV